MKSPPMTRVDKSYGRSNALEAAEARPDQLAESIKLSKKTGVPSDVIERNVPKVKKDHYESVLSQQLSDNKFVGEYFKKDPDTAKLSHDDMGVMTKLSQLSWQVYLLSGQVAVFQLKWLPEF